jgi:hypothetical protein
MGKEKLTVYLTEWYVDLFPQMPPAQLSYLHLKGYATPHTLQHHTPFQGNTWPMFWTSDIV